MRARKGSETTPPRAVLFDCFGTLVEFERDRTALGDPRCHALLRSWGHDLSHGEFVTIWDEASRELEASTSGRLVEVSMQDYAAAFGRRSTRGLSPGQRDELAITFVAEWRACVRPVEGGARLLERLGSRLRLGVVSNTNDAEMVPQILREQFGAVRFDAVV